MVKRDRISAHYFALRPHWQVGNGAPLTAILLLGMLSLIIPASAKSSEVGVQLASDITAQQAAAIRRQVAEKTSVTRLDSAGWPRQVNASGTVHHNAAKQKATPCSGDNLASSHEYSASCREAGIRVPGMRLVDHAWGAYIAERHELRPADGVDSPNHWRDNHLSDARSPVHRSLNRPVLDLSERRTDDWVRQLGLLGVDPLSARQLTQVRIQFGKIVEGRTWRPTAIFDATRGPLLDRNAIGERRAQRAAQANFVRYPYRLGTDTVRKISTDWPGVTRKAWRHLRFGPDPRLLQPGSASSMSVPSASPWDFTE